jgi:hypothetical protein
MSDTPDTKHAMTRLITETWASFHIRQKLELEAIERERDELRERVGELENALQWYVDNDESFDDDDTGFWATGQRTADALLAKTKEAK